MNKLNLLLNEAVVIQNTNSPLDGEFGRNYGVAVDGVVTVYIILLDVPTETHKAVTIPGVCLRRAKF